MLDLTHILFITLLLLTRVALMWGYQWLAASAYAEKTRIYPRVITEEQNRRENRSWPFIFISQALLTLFFAGVGGFNFLPINYWSFPAILLIHIFIIEPVYYFYHVLLHTKYLYNKYHIYHHRSIIVEPRTSVSFTFIEDTTYTFLFAIPFFILSYFDMLSYSVFFIYTLFFDFANYTGHANFEFFPRWWVKTPLKWVFYTPSFHSQHHKYFRQNYSLFMPIYDKLFNTLGKKTDEIFVQSLNRSNV